MSVAEKKRNSLQDLKTSDPEAKLGICQEEEEEESKSVPERRKDSPAPTDTTSIEQAPVKQSF